MKPMKTWGDWHTWARRSYSRYDPAPFPFNTHLIPQSEMEDLLWRANCQSRQGCEQTIQRLGDSGRWPPSATENAYFLARRLEYAMEILTVIGTWIPEEPNYAVPPPQAPPRIILRWLLRDAWEACGWRRWMVQFLAGHEQRFGLRL